MKSQWKGSGVSSSPLDWQQHKDMQISKTALIKSLMEAGAIADRTPESEQLIEDWIEYIYRNSEKDKKLLQIKDTQGNEVPFK